ncbi:MAG: replication restart DNA helicase PriA [Cyanobacteria bacterium P01_C01_bin.72]
MEHSLLIRCSDCGGVAKRTYSFALDTIVKTECCHCDYYLVVDFFSGKVIEAQTSCTAINLHQKAA